MRVTKTYRFEASHILPKHPGKCSRLHGHSWVLKVSVDGPVNPKTGFVIDYGDISKVMKPIVESLDHRHLGTWIPATNAGAKLPLEGEWRVKGLLMDFYPTSENLLFWIAGQLLRGWEEADYGNCLNWSQLELNETCTSAAVLTREEFDESQK